MNFTEETDIQVSLPQFSEISSRSNSGLIVSTSDLQTIGNTIYTTAVTSNSGKNQQILVTSPNKYPGTILSWPDPNTIIQLCQKEGIQTINIPSYSQAVSNNASILGVQSNSLSENGQLSVQQQSSSMTEYLQKLQATTLPLTLQQLIKLQTEQIKREKLEEDTKIEQSQNNILNIPSVPGFRNSQLQNGSHYLLNPDNSILAINSGDSNINIENHSESDIGSQTIKIEQQVQTESLKPEKKMKFRAKTGEIKITMAMDGSTLYCCPECNLAFTDKSEVEQHIQGHIQERKYQCKECGAMLKRKEHLDQHMRGHSNERPFKCPVCQKAFKRNEHLTRHYVIHSGDKNFSCGVCQKAFSRKDHLNKHAQTHLGIKRTKAKTKELFSDKDSLEKIAELSASIPKQDMNFIIKESNFIKQESALLQHIQNLQRDPNLLQTFSAFKEQALKDANIFQQQAVNMNEILPQNTRYLMPS